MDGVAAEAIRDAESALARQQSVIAQVDLQVIAAVLNAHTDRDRGTAVLEQLQQDLETAVAARPDLDTHAGARSFQRYLIGKLRDIRTVVDTAGLDAASQAALAAALSSLYASTAEPAEPVEAVEPVDAVGAPEEPVVPDGPAAVPAAAPVAPAPSMPAAPAWGATAPSSDGIGSMPPLPDLAANDLPPAREHAGHHPRPDPPADPADGSAAVVLPSGQTVAAPSPELSNVISAALAGTPIADAFAGQGITIPAVGSPVAAPVDATQLIPGDVAIFTDRYALALGNGRALLDNRTQPISAVSGPDFIGWQHPPSPANDRNLQ
jgi:hypothetical protein